MAVLKMPRPANFRSLRIFARIKALINIIGTCITKIIPVFFSANKNMGSFVNRM